MLHPPHPRSHGAQLGSHFAAPLWPSHPHQPCATEPSPGGEATGNQLRTRDGYATYGIFICLDAFVISKLSDKMYSKEIKNISHKKVKLTRGSVNEQHFTQIPDQLNGQQNGNLQQKRG